MRKFVSLNFLSLIGYLSFLAMFVFLMTIVPLTIRFNNQIHDGGMGFFYYWAGILINYYIILAFLLIIAIMLAIVEFLLSKSGKTINQPKILTKCHSAIFWMGVILVPTPFYVVALVYGVSTVISVFKG